MSSCKVLPPIGNTLEDVQFVMAYCDRLWLKVLDLLQKHCARLTRIICRVPFTMIGEDGNWPKRYASLLCSYDN